MQNFKTNQKGITLIALIITIIVMLILVGVTINVALNGGLFEKGEKAAFQTEASTVKEQLEIAKALEVMEQKGKPVEDYSGITVMKLQDLDSNTKSKFGNKLVVAKNGDICYNPANVTDQEKAWLEEIGIKALSGEEPEIFDWSTVGLGNVVIGVNYVLRVDPIIYALNFKENGNLEVKKDGVVDKVVIAKDNIVDGKLKFSYNVGLETDIILTMNGENVDAELLALEGAKYTYVKETDEQVDLVYGPTNNVYVVRTTDDKLKYVYNGNIEASYEIEEYVGTLAQLIEEKFPEYAEYEIRGGADRFGKYLIGDGSIQGAVNNVGTEFYSIDAREGEGIQLGDSYKLDLNLTLEDILK